MAEKKDCPRCRRARWVLTAVVLTTMAVVLYLNYTTK